MKNILCVQFRTQVTLLTVPLDGWSKRKGDHSATMANSTCVELDNRDVLLTWTGGKEPRKLTVPRENIACIEYDEAPVAKPEGKAK